MIDLEQEQEEVRTITSRLDHLEQTVEREEKELKKIESRVIQTQQAQESCDSYDGT